MPSGSVATGALSIGGEQSLGNELGAQMNVLISLAGAEQAIRAMRFALDAKEAPKIGVGIGSGLAH